MSTLQCLSRDALKEYLSGWTDAEQSDAIEMHLTQCSSCEQTIHSIENDPETLIEFVRTVRNESPIETPLADSAVVYALSRAKKISENIDPPTVPWQPPVGEFGPYELIRPLGHGGMATVYLARHRQLGKQVAIKLLPARQFRNDHYAARFQREIRTAGQLNHPAIVNATDAGEQEGTHYLVMEYIDGLDLSRVARLHGPLGISDACAIMRTVAIGLSHAHAEGIVHRDIKPSNLMLSVTGDVKILDFGLAQVHLWDEMSAELTTVGQLMGTLDYMAPEQAERPEAVDYRADLYSIGATLFRLLCGRAPLAAAPDLSPLVKLRLLGSHQPPRLDTLRIDAPEKLVEFVSQLLARDPAARPASAAHVAEQLAQFSESADLKSLITSARANATQKPETASSLTLAKTPKAQVTSSEGGRRISRWWLVASLLPLFILAGVLITLETQKGQLVIESESANVEVKLLREGEVYEKLKIVPGITSTRLYAGKYEVVIDASSDSVTFDQPEIEIKRAQTLIARVSVPKVVSNADGDKDPSIVAAPVDIPRHSEEKTADPEPIYEGKTLSDWLEQFARERSPAGTSSALAAIGTLVSESNAKRVEKVLLDNLRSLGNRWIGEGDQSKQIDAVAFPILARCFKVRKDYYAMLANELASGDEEWATRIFKSSVERYSWRPEDIEPLVAWIEANVLKMKKSPEMTDSAAKLFYAILDGSESTSDFEPIKNRLVDSLANSEQLGLDFWLSRRPSYVGNWGGPSNVPVPFRPFYPRFASAIESKAIAVIIDDKSTDVELIEAVALVNALNSRAYDRKGMTARLVANEFKLAQAIGKRLTLQMADTEHRLACATLRTRFNGLPDQSYRGALPFVTKNTAVPAFLKLTEIDSGWTQGNGANRNIALELLDCIASLKLESSLQPQLLSAVELSQEKAQEFGSNLKANLSYFRPGDLSLSISLDRLDAPIRPGDMKMSEGDCLDYMIFTKAFRMLPEDQQKEIEDEYWSTQIAKAGEGKLEPALLEWSKRQIAKYDINKDGMLTVDEWSSMVSKPDGADTNNDGMLTVEEYAAYKVIAK